MQALYHESIYIYTVGIGIKLFVSTGRGMILSLNLQLPPQRSQEPFHSCAKYGRVLVPPYKRCILKEMLKKKKKVSHTDSLLTAP